MKLRYLGLLVLMVACNQPTGRGGPGQVTPNQAAKIYPHSEVFKKTEHGTHYVADRDLCMRCHTPSGDGGTSKVACSTCHGSFPHAPGWSYPTQHGANYLAADADGRAKCAKCHSKQDISCQSCHAVYPHTKAFSEDLEDHAKFAGQVAGKCVICHTDYKRHMTNYSEGCLDCHFGAELKVDWHESATGAVMKTKTFVKRAQDRKRLPSSPKK